MPNPQPEMGRFMCCLCFGVFTTVEEASYPQGFAPYMDQDKRQDVCWPCAWADGPAQLLAAIARLAGHSGSTGAGES